MNLDITCKGCDATFEADLADLVDDPTLQCPTCDARAPKAAIEGVTGALDELFTKLASLERKFTLSMTVESDDLPAGYDEPPPRRAAARDEDEDEDDEEEDDDDEDDEGSDDWAEDDDDEDAR